MFVSTFWGFFLHHHKNFETADSLIPSGPGGSWGALPSYRCWLAKDAIVGCNVWLLRSPCVARSLAAITSWHIWDNQITQVWIKIRTTISHFKHSQVRVQDILYFTSCHVEKVKTQPKKWNHVQSAFSSPRIRLVFGTPFWGELHFWRETVIFSWRRSTFKGILITTTPEN